MSTKPQHIAVMRLSAMGDVAMTVPVLRAFANQNPNVKITLISRLFFKPFFEEIPNLTFFVFDEKQQHKGFLGLIRLFFDLKKQNIDAFADLHNVLRSKIVRTLFVLSGKKVAFTNKARDEKKALTREENKIFEPLTTVFERHAIVFRELGFSLDLTNPTFPEKQNLDAKIKQLVGKKTTKWIGIAPFAQYESKVYPIDLMREVICELSQNKENTIFLFGGGNHEIKILEMIARENENCISIAGKVTFLQELQLISNLDIMLSMDSGNGHIAAMFGIKVITLFGSTHPFLGFSPFNQPLENALVSDRNLFPKLPTSIYGNKKVAGYEGAMRTILPEQIIEKIVQ